MRYTSKFVERIPVKFGVSEKRVEVLDTRRCVLNPICVFYSLSLPLASLDPRHLDIRGVDGKQQTVPKH